MEKITLIQKEGKKNPTYINCSQYILHTFPICREKMFILNQFLCMVVGNLHITRQHQLSWLLMIINNNIE